MDQRKAHYYFSVKGNQLTLLDDITTYFSNDSSQAHYEDKVSVGHGRIEIRRIWVTSELNEYVLFPHVAQIYRIEREITDKKSGKTSLVTAYGVTSRIKEDADPKPSYIKFVVTGLLKSVIILLTGFLMKIAQQSVPGMGLKT